MISVTKSFRDININPLHYSVLVIYGLTRFIEYLTNTNQLWSKLWILIVDFFGDDDFSMYFTASTLHSVLFIYWFYGGIYVLFDVTQWPKCIRKYKVRNGTNESMDTKLLIKAARVAFINQITITIPLTYVGYLIIKFRGKNRSFYDVPDFLTVVWQLLICIAVDEILFYYSHRFLHQNPYLYRLVHKKHHEWTAPIAIAASYAHPVEHIISNVLPISLGPVFINAHLSIAWIWHTLAIITTLSNHLGYHLPFLNSPEFHDFHHLKFTGCYGNLGILDRIHGTDQLFRESIHNLRHTTIFSLKSAREKFPDKSS